MHSSVVTLLAALVLPCRAARCDEATVEHVWPLYRAAMGSGATSESIAEAVKAHRFMECTPGPLAVFRLGMLLSQQSRRERSSSLLDEALLALEASANIGNDHDPTRERALVQRALISCYIGRGPVGVDDVIASPLPDKMQQRSDEPHPTRLSLADDVRELMVDLIELARLLLAPPQPEQAANATAAARVLERGVRHASQAEVPHDVRLAGTWGAAGGALLLTEEGAPLVDDEFGLPTAAGKAMRRLEHAASMSVFEDSEAAHEEGDSGVGQQPSGISSEAVLALTIQLLPRQLLPPICLGLEQLGRPRARRALGCAERVTRRPVDAYGSTRRRV